MADSPVTNQALEKRPSKQFVSKRNPFRLGDIVQHGSSGHRGMVVEVVGDQVKFWDPTVRRPDGKRFTRRFSYTKLIMLLTREQALEKARAIQAQDNAAEAPAEKLSRWTRFKNFFKPNTPAQPATV